MQSSTVVTGLFVLLTLALGYLLALAVQYANDSKPVKQGPNRLKNSKRRDGSPLYKPTKKPF